MEDGPAAIRGLQSDAGAVHESLPAAGGGDAFGWIYERFKRKAPPAVTRRFRPTHGALFEGWNSTPDGDESFGLSKMRDVLIFADTRFRT